MVETAITEPAHATPDDRFGGTDDGDVPVQPTGQLPEAAQ
jgi:hypothetical protein